MALFGCAKDPDPYVQNPSNRIWTYGPEAITLNVKAVEQLNLYDKKAHTLAVCVYQLSSEKGFGELAQNKAGIDRLVACSRFDDSVVNFEQAFFEPGASRTLRLNRHEGSRYLAIAAGYYDFSPSHSTRTVPIPVVNVADTFIPASVGPSHKEAGPLRIDVYLEKTGLHIAAPKR